MVTSPHHRHRRTRSWRSVAQTTTSLATAAIIAATWGAGTAAAASSLGSSTDTTAAAARLPFGGVQTDSCDGAVATAPTLMFGSGAAAGGMDVPATTIGVVCSLPYTNGKPGSDCTGKHTITFSTVGTSSNAQVTSELLALDASGNQLAALKVKNGDTAQLASRLSPSDWKFVSSGSTHQLFAPIPLLHIKVVDQGQTAEAFCSNIPYVQVLSPKGDVASDSGGSNDTNVVAAVPLTNPSQIHLTVDGVDVISALTPNPQGCTALSPCGGAVTINGNTVNVSNLIVDVASSISTPASNTVRATISDLACGGHYFNVNGVMLPGALRNPTSSACDIDDLKDSGSASVFGVSISDPVEGQITPIVPTPVVGEVCGGTQIAALSINGKSLDVSGQAFTPGNGTTTGDTYKLTINTTIDRTDLVTDAILQQDTPNGTFDAGTNRLAVSATDVGGNRAFVNRIFATGAVAPIAIDPNAQVFNSAAIQSAISTNLKSLVQQTVTPLLTPTTTELDNAFVVGLSAAGTQTLFNKLCSAPLNDPSSPFNGMTPGQIFQKKISDAIFGIGEKHISPDVPCASDPDVKLTISNVSVGDTLNCNVTFNDHFFHVTVGLPNIHVDVHAFGTGGDWGDDICVEGVKVEGDAFADVTNIKLDFDVTEDNLLNNTTSSANFDAGATVASNGSVGADFCGLSVVCNVVVTIFTFGAVDINPEIDFSKVQDFSKQIGASQPDPVKLNEIKVDESVIANFDQKVSGKVSSVHISTDGITAGLKGEFATLAVDEDVPSTPGVTLTPAAIPTLPVPNAQDVFIGLADDSINMMFASLTAAGRLQTGPPTGNSCVDTGKTIGDLLPADCNSLNGPSDAATAAFRGYCQAIKGGSCEALSMGTAVLTATEQGICHGAAGDTCSSIPTTVGSALVEIGACNITPNYNLHAAQGLLFCAKGNVPPRMLLADNSSTSAVESVLRVNDLSVQLVVDRDGDHAVADPTALQGCFTKGLPTVGDCNAVASCLDLDMNFSMQFQTCSDGKPGFKSNFSSIQVKNQTMGSVCGGSTTATTDGAVLEQSSSDTITIPIGNNAAQFSPDICGAGLDLGGFVTCGTPQILSIDAGGPGAPSLKDYLAITCKVQ